MRVRTFYRKVGPRGGFVRGLTSREVRICIQMQSEVTDVVTDPPVGLEVLRRVHIAHEPVQSTIALWGPTGEVAGKVPDRPQEIRTSDARSVEHLHHNLSCDGI